MRERGDVACRSFDCRKLRGCIVIVLEAIYSPKMSSCLSNFDEAIEVAALNRKTMVTVKDSSIVKEIIVFGAGIVGHRFL